MWRTNLCLSILSWWWLPPLIRFLKVCLSLSSFLCNVLERTWRNEREAHTLSVSDEKGNWAESDSCCLPFSPSLSVFVLSLERQVLWNVDCRSSLSLDFIHSKDFLSAFILVSHSTLAVDHPLASSSSLFNSSLHLLSSPSTCTSSSFNWSFITINIDWHFCFISSLLLSLLLSSSPFFSLFFSPFFSLLLLTVFFSFSWLTLWSLFYQIHREKRDEWRREQSFFIPFSHLISESCPGFLVTKPSCFLWNLILHQNEKETNTRIERKTLWIMQIPGEWRRRKGVNLFRVWKKKQGSHVIFTDSLISVPPSPCFLNLIAMKDGETLKSSLLCIRRYRKERSEEGVYLSLSLHKPM